MCHEKRKLTQVSGARSGTDPADVKCWVKDFILPSKYHAPNLAKYFVIL